MRFIYFSYKITLFVSYSVGSIGGPHSNDTRSGTPSGIVGGMQRQLSSDGLERPPSMGGGSCKDEGNTKYAEVLYTHAHIIFSYV